MIARSTTKEDDKKQFLLSDLQGNSFKGRDIQNRYTYRLKDLDDYGVLRYDTV